MGGLVYEDSGVSIARGDAASADAFSQLTRTFNSYSVLLKGLVALRANFRGMKDPLLALACDGVGTKLKYAFASGKHDTVGVDLVAMCVNDLARNNITPLGFALYRATSRIDPEVMHAVVGGVVEGCRQAGCVCTTGETAEMPDFYASGEYDLAGFAVGVFDRKDLITGEAIRGGDAVFGLVSSGPHSNGFSLIRRVYPPWDLVGNKELLAQILEPTRIYVQPVLKASQRFGIHGWAHITGGGIVGKLGKIIPVGLQARLRWGSWPVPDIFDKIQARGSVPIEDMRSTFNLGLGMIGVVPAGLTTHIENLLFREGEKIYIIGEIIQAEQDEKVVFV